MTGIEQKTFVAMAGEHVEPANSDADSASTPGRPDAGGKSALASRLETISSKAVAKLDEIMGLPLDPDHPAFAPVLRAQTAAANTALSTQAKVEPRCANRSTTGCRNCCAWQQKCGRDCLPWRSWRSRGSNRKPVPAPVCHDDVGLQRILTRVSGLLRLPVYDDRRDTKVRFRHAYFPRVLRKPPSEPFLCNHAARRCISNYGRRSIEFLPFSLLPFAA